MTGRSRSGSTFPDGCSTWWGANSPALRREPDPPGLPNEGRRPAPARGSQTPRLKPIPIKAAMKLLGRDTGELRLPMTALDDTGMAKLKKTLSAYGLL